MDYKGCKEKQNTHPKEGVKLKHKDVLETDEIKILWGETSWLWERKEFIFRKGKLMQEKHTG